MVKAKNMFSKIAKIKDANGHAFILKLARKR